MTTSAEQIHELVREHGGVISTAEARKSGLSEAALKWAVRKAALKPLRRGVYTSGRLWENSSPTGRHLLLILAAQRVHPDLVACATSAAIALGLPTPHGIPDLALLSAPRDLRRHGGRGVRARSLGRRSWLRDDEIRTLNTGVRVTSPLRTTLDCSREWDRGWGLAVADAAITRSDFTAADLLAAALDRPPAPGTGRSVWVARWARSGPESPLESLARAVVITADLPEPTPQVWLTTSYGRVRVDLLDIDNQVIIEADGKLKYTSEEYVWQEKRREDALRDLGFEVVRFIMSDYRHPSSWLATYRRALTRAARGRG